MQPPHVVRMLRAAGRLRLIQPAQNPISKFCRTTEVGEALEQSVELRFINS